MSPRNNRGVRLVDDNIDMLCPICEESCSCTGQTELVIHPRKSSKNKKRPIKKLSSPSACPNPKKVPKVSFSQSRTPIKKGTKKSTGSFLLDGQTNGAVTDGSISTGLKGPRETSREGKSDAHVTGHRSFPINRSPSFYDEKWNEDLDVQYALSEYYFSGDEESSEFDNDMMIGEEAMMEDDSEVVADYYGYSSGTDMAMESLFAGTSESECCSEEESEGGENLETGTILLTTVDMSNDTTKRQLSPEESLSEQLAKITPQILAAISVAAKNMACSSYTNSTSIPCQPIYQGSYNMTVEDYGGRDNSLRLDELMDTKKLAMILSTSPPQSNSLMGNTSQRRSVPIDAFRRSRRNSIQTQVTSLSNALRSNSLATCTLTDTPNWFGVTADIEIDIHMEIDTEETSRCRASQDADDEASCSLADEIDTDPFTWTLPSMIL